MTKVQLADISLPYDKMIELRKAGKLMLGIDHSVALKLQSAGIRPKGSATAAFGFFKLLAIGALAAGLYYAFTSAWWWGIVGFVAMTMIWNGNKSGHSENLLDAAMDDPEFYERVRSLRGWLYQVDEDVAAEISGRS